jgi:anti-anti-sigma regulatory factor
MSASGSLASGMIHVTIVESIPVLRPVDPDFLSEQAKEFSRLVDLLRKKSLNDLVLDLSSCRNISSEGLGIISACWQWCQEKGKGYMGVVLPRSKENEVVNLFDITGLSRSIGSALQRSVRDAIRYLRAFSPLPAKKKS